MALLGLTFKADTDDLRESPSLRIGQLLLDRGAHVAAYDPMALEAGVAQLSDGPSALVEASASAEDALRGADAAVVATEWPELSQLDWATVAPTMRGHVVADARRVVDVRAAKAAGIEVLSLGVPGRSGPRRAPSPSWRFPAAESGLPPATLHRGQEDDRDHDADGCTTPSISTSDGRPVRSGTNDWSISSLTP